MDSNISEMMEKLLKSNDVPENVKEVFNSFASNSAKSNNLKDEDSNNLNSTNSTSFSKNDSSDNEHDISGIDINTILKFQKIMKNMNSNQNSSSANLLRSLKPYLNSSRQEKVDQYIQLLKMEKVFEMFGNDMGGKK